MESNDGLDCIKMIEGEGMGGDTEEIRLAISWELLKVGDEYMVVNYTILFPFLRVGVFPHKSKESKTKPPNSWQSICKTTLLTLFAYYMFRGIYSSSLIYIHTDSMGLISPIKSERR